jgi:hypothetical protein
MTATQHPSAADDQASTPDRRVGTPAREPDSTGPQGWALKANLIADLTGRLDAGAQDRSHAPQLDVCRVAWGCRPVSRWLTSKVLPLASGSETAHKAAMAARFGSAQQPAQRRAPAHPARRVPGRVWDRARSRTDAMPSSAHTARIPMASTYIGLALPSSRMGPAGIEPATPSSGEDPGPRWQTTWYLPGRRGPRLLRGAVNGPEALSCCPSSSVRGGRRP